MNERIKELARQAGMVNDKYGMYFAVIDHADGVDLEKFAELFLQECSNRLMQDDFSSVKGQMRITVAKLKEHFGIEE